MDYMQKRVLANVSTLIKFQLINLLQKMNEINPLGRGKLYDFYWQKLLETIIIIPLASGCWIKFF